LINRVHDQGEPEWVDAITHATLPGIWRPALRAGVKTVVAFPVLVGREVVAVLELFSDQIIRRSEGLIMVMANVGAQLGRIIERRRLQHGFAEATWQEQQRVIHELHDGLGQELTGLSLSAKGLVDRLQRQGLPEAKQAARVTAGVKLVLLQIRRLSRGLFPVDAGRTGLMRALRQLVASTNAITGIRCRFDCPRPVSLTDIKVATHLYRIAQEAVTNALRHAQPKTISVGIRSASGVVTLRVGDDGIGFSSHGRVPQGTGLRIMRYRADVIGAMLKIEPGRSRGTVVTCTLTRGLRTAESGLD
jgi:signal transduction histidine kinase